LEVVCEHDPAVQRASMGAAVHQRETEQRTGEPRAQLYSHARAPHRVGFTGEEEGKKGVCKQVPRCRPNPFTAAA